MTEGEYAFLVESVEMAKKARPGIQYCVMGEDTYRYIRDRQKGKEGCLGLGVAVCKAIDTPVVLWFSNEKDAVRFARKVEKEIATGDFTWTELHEMLKSNLVPLRRVN